MDLIPTLGAQFLWRKNDAHSVSEIQETTIVKYWESAFTDHCLHHQRKDPLYTYSTKLPAQNRKPITFRLYEGKRAFYLNIKMSHISGLISILNNFGSKQTEEAIVSKVFSYVTDIYWWSKNWGSCSDKYKNTRWGKWVMMFKMRVIPEKSEKEKNFHVPLRKQHFLVYTQWLRSP